MPSNLATQIKLMASTSQSLEVNSLIKNMMEIIYQSSPMIGEIVVVNASLTEVYVFNTEEMVQHVNQSGWGMLFYSQIDKESLNFIRDFHNGLVHFGF